MRALRHVARLPRQQQEYAHRFAIGLSRHAGALALRGMRDHADANGGEQAELAEPAPECDRIVDRATARIQHQRRAAKIPAMGKIFKILEAVGGDNADCADPSAAVRLACHPAKLHRQLALFKRGTRKRSAKG